MLYVGPMRPVPGEEPLISGEDGGRGTQKHETPRGSAYHTTAQQQGRYGCEESCYCGDPVFLIESIKGNHPAAARLIASPAV